MSAIILIEALFIIMTVVHKQHLTNKKMDERLKLRDTIQIWMSNHPCHQNLHPCIKGNYDVILDYICEVLFRIDIKS